MLAVLKVLGKLMWKLKWELSVLKSLDNFTLFIALLTLPELKAQVSFSDHLSKLNQTWHKSSMVGGDSNLF